MTDPGYVPGNTAAAYDRSRAAMPAELAGLLVELTGGAAPRVVDLGAGTGLSCLAWRGLARKVFAVEPSAKHRELMRERFGARLATGEFAVIDATAERTGLPDGCADVITACGSLHWFDPSPALAEVARLLRPGGVFAICNPKRTPLIGDWETDQALCAVGDAIKQAIPQYGSGHAPTGAITTAAGKRELIERSGHFRALRRLWMHAVEEGGGERALELAGTLGAYRLLKEGADEGELGLPRLREAVRGGSPSSASAKWYWSFDIQLALR